MRRLENTLSREFSIQEKYSRNILAMFEEGATVPFIARYRKESTGGMLDVDLRRFHERWQYLVELEKRRMSILTVLENKPDCPKGVITKINQAITKSELEDIFAPFKTTRKSKASEAIEIGLKPLAEDLWAGTLSEQPKDLVQWMKNNSLEMEVQKALEGALDIIIETLSQDTELLKQGRSLLLSIGEVQSKLVRGKKDLGEKYRDYFDYSEAVKKIPSHRLLALFRGKKEAILKLSINLPNETVDLSRLNLDHLAFIFSPQVERNAALCKLSVNQKRYLFLAWEKKLSAKLESDIFSVLKEQAEEGAINVFANNLNDLLMSAPAGPHRVIGVDPGFRNGVKLAVINEFGEVVDHGVIYPFTSDAQKQKAISSLLNYITQHNVEWLAIGNGTASRETEQLANQLIEKEGLSCRAVVVSEAGASVYSASDVAISEFPDLDVTIRGAVSIARRFQDPLAELVKIDPQAIGVGQYQHDVKPAQLASSLANVVEDCVNKVGVDVNLASASLLSYVAGLSNRMAQNIIDYRRQKGRIESRGELLKVKGIGAKGFEQCAGFLRVLEGCEVLDSSGVHPESYPLVRTMAKAMNMQIQSLLGNVSAINQLQLKFADFSGVDRYTFDDTLKELAKPGRDPRPEFRYAEFDQGVQSMSDLVEGMSLEGVVTNVAAFGAFVDIGVHQDGLIHISQLADRFVKDPRDLVRVGQVIKVTVLEVDEKRKRISLKATGL
ncbi:Tex family protein [Marinomonas flavescens]|uniref:Tex family protein n=1 Tax=Marinomonas flavescens TaxID=2529379 RepID=UPI001054E974|nr:Tex family protein [Marinomonas flavescens]